MNNAEILQQLRLAQEHLQSAQASEAKRVLKRLLKQHPKVPDAWALTAQAERALKQWAPAAEAVRKACALAPGNLHYREQLATILTYSDQGRDLVPAIQEWSALLALLPHSPSAPAIAANLATLCMRCDMPQPILDRVLPFFEQVHVSGPERLRLAAYIAVAAYLVNDVATSATYVKQALALRQFAYDANDKRLPGDYPFLYIYCQFIQGLLEVRSAAPELYAGTPSGMLHAIGESHSLTPAKLTVGAWRVQPHLIMGAKVFHFTNPDYANFRYTLERIIRELPQSEPILMMFGEIDCRPTEGILKQWMSHANYDMPAEVMRMVTSYVRILKGAQRRRTAPIFLYGVPAPHVSAKAEVPPERHEDYCHLIRTFNAVLKQQAFDQGIVFADVYSHTVGEGGWAKAGVHLDNVHLTPATVATILATIS